MIYDHDDFLEPYLYVLMLQYSRFVVIIDLRMQLDASVQG